jgi:hypothetical protein
VTAVALPSDLADRLRERTRTLVGELIPDEAITAFVTGEIKAMFEVKSAKLYDCNLEKTDSYGNSRSPDRICGAFEEVTPVQALVRITLREHLVKQIQTVLDGNRGIWNDGGSMAGPFAQEVTKAIAPHLVKSMFESIVQNALNQLRPH